MYSENQLASLKKTYNKTLWTYIGVSALAVAGTFLMMYSPSFAPTNFIPWLFAAGAGLVLAIVEYALERALYKKGKRAAPLLIGFVLLILLVCLILWKTDAYGTQLMPLYGFLFNRPLIPAIGLLRDHRRMNDGNPCETVGRMQAGSHRHTAMAVKENYLLFEDELTHEIHLLLMGSLDPAHRYRVLYLPHSGLAVGEVVPDNVTFDPFGNPVEREHAERETVEIPETEIPAYTEETYAEKPPYTEEDMDTTAAEATYSSASPSAEELNPNSPARQKAARFALASKVCKGMAYAGFVLTFIGGIILEDSLGVFLVFPAFLFMFGGFLLGDYFKKQDRRLRCTRRTTARCVDTVRRKSGKHSSTRHPIVGYEVNGVSYTAELSVSCTRDSVGELYPIYYDPLDPEAVRVE